MTMKLLRELSEAAGVPGREENIRKIVMRELKGHVDSMTVDAMGNLIAFRRGTAKERQRIGDGVRRHGSGECRRRRSRVRRRCRRA